MTKPEEVYPICTFKPRKKKPILETGKSSRYQSTIEVLHEALQNQENYDSSTLDQIKKTERLFLMHEKRQEDWSKLQGRLSRRTPVQPILKLRPQVQPAKRTLIDRQKDFQESFIPEESLLAPPVLDPYAIHSGASTTASSSYRAKIQNLFS